MKIMKKILLCLLAMTMLLSLASCNALDEMKARHAIFDKETKTISWNGDTYVHYEGDISLLRNSVNYREPVYVTYQDVPVLFSQAEGTMFFSNSSKDILYTDNESGIYSAMFNETNADEYFAYFDETAYIKKGMEEEIENKLNKAKLDHYCIAGPEEDILLPEEMASVLNDIIKNNKTTMSEMEYAKFTQEDYYYNDSISLYRCDEDLLVTDYIGEIQLFTQMDTEEEVLILVVTNGNSDGYARLDSEMYSEIQDLFENKDDVKFR